MIKVRIRQIGGKGQVLMITAIIVVLVLFLIRTEVTYMGSCESSGTGNVPVFENMRNEMRRSGQITIWSGNYSSVYDFSDFLRNQKDTEVFYSITDFEDSNLNITLVNFLDETIQEINISQNLTDETGSINLLADGSGDWVNFTSSEGSEKEFHVNITYANSAGTITSYTFDALAGPEKYVTVFFDLKLNYHDSYIEDRFSVSGKRN